jgi:hypothetical protein
MKYVRVLLATVLILLPSIALAQHMGPFDLSLVKQLGPFDPRLAKQIGPFGVDLSPDVPLTCTELYAPSLTWDTIDDIGRYALRDFSGFKYIPATDQCVCSVDFYARVVGTPTGNLHLRIFTIDGSDQPTASIGVSSGIAAGSAATQTWISQNAGTLDFATCVNLTSGTAYGFGFFRDTDANLDGDTEVDGTNAVQFYYDDEANSDAIQGGKFRWTWAASFPYAVQDSDLEDDVLVKIKTMQ